MELEFKMDSVYSQLHKEEKALLKGDIFTCFFEANGGVAKQKIYVVLAIEPPSISSSSSSSSSNSPVLMLYWCPTSIPFQKSKRRSLKIRRVTDLYLRKKYKVFAHPTAAAANEDCCFSLVVRKKKTDIVLFSLNLEAENKKVKSIWLKGLSSLLSSSGRRMIPLDTRRTIGSIIPTFAYPKHEVQATGKGKKGGASFNSFSSIIWHYLTSPPSLHHVPQSAIAQSLLRGSRVHGYFPSAATSALKQAQSPTQADALTQKPPSNAPPASPATATRITQSPLSQNRRISTANTSNGTGSPVHIELDIYYIGDLGKAIHDPEAFKKDPGALIWHQAGRSKDTKPRLMVKLNHIAAIYVDKRSPIFKSPSLSKVASEYVLTIVANLGNGQKKLIDLEARSVQTKMKWVMGMYYVLSACGKQLEVLGLDSPRDLVPKEKPNSSGTANDSGNGGNSNNDAKSNGARGDAKEREEEDENKSKDTAVHTNNNSNSAHDGADVNKNNHGKEAKVDKGRENSINRKDSSRYRRENSFSRRENSYNSYNRNESSYNRRRERESSYNRRETSLNRTPLREHSYHSERRETSRNNNHHLGDNLSFNHHFPPHFGKLAEVNSNDNELHSNLEHEHGNNAPGMGCDDFDSTLSGGDSDDFSPSSNSAVHRLRGITKKKNPHKVFKLLSKLGQGSYASVYKAQHRKTKQIYAIKILETESEGIKELNEEIRMLRKCDSSYIVSYHGSYMQGTQIWIVMDYCGGGSFCDLMAICERTLTETEIAAVMRMALLGLEYLHVRKKIHRDIKSGNILINEQGICKLADFGVSTQLTQTMSKRLSVIGTPYWMAPEVLNTTAEYNHKADIWSLGITAFELAMGKPPLAHIHPMRVIFLIPRQEAPRLPDEGEWSEEFRDFVRSCLNKDPEQRLNTSTLLRHPFIANAGGSEVVRDLVQDSMPNIEYYRSIETKIELENLQTNVADSVNDYVDFDGDSSDSSNSYSRSSSRSRSISRSSSYSTNSVYSNNKYGSKSYSQSRAGSGSNSINTYEDMKRIRRNIMNRKNFNSLGGRTSPSLPSSPTPSHRSLSSSVRKNRSHSRLNDSFQSHHSYTSLNSSSAVQRGSRGKHLGLQLKTAASDSKHQHNNSNSSSSSSGGGGGRGGRGGGRSSGSGSSRAERRERSTSRRRRRRMRKSNSYNKLNKITRAIASGSPHEGVTSFQNGVNVGLRGDGSGSSQRQQRNRHEHKSSALSKNSGSDNNSNSDATNASTYSTASSTNSNTHASGSKSTSTSANSTGVATGKAKTIEKTILHFETGQKCTIPETVKELQKQLQKLGFEEEANPLVMEIETLFVDGQGNTSREVAPLKVPVKKIFEIIKFI